ncbi:MAG: CHAT domain-containing protein [Phaeodactylibacter sp.]|nr:CHAT domain-containing protein [Phaeodactylibacter sp.]
MPSAETLLPQLFAALGNTFNYEEGLGDYRKARRFADELVQGHLSGPDAALALFYSAVTDILRGGQVRAANSLEQLAAATEQDTPLYLLAFTFLQFCRFERYNTRLDGAGSDAIEASARWDVKREMEDYFPRLHQLQAQCTDIPSRNLSWYLSNILGVAKNARNIADKLRDPYLKEAYQQQHESMLHSFERYAQQALGEQRWPDVLFPNYLRAGFLFSSGEKEQGRTLLAETLELAEEHGDFGRQALCWQQRGDWLCAPFSHPLSWDFSLTDSSNESSVLPPYTEALEHQPLPPGALDEAGQCYEKAMLFFRQAGALRGQAFILLRQAYLSWRSNAPDAALGQIREAGQLFEVTGDERGLQLAYTHELLVQLSGRPFAGAEAAMTAIGQWGHDSGNFSYAVSLGNLCNRLARHLFLRQGRYEASRLAYGASYRLFEALGADINASQCLVDQALLQEAAGDAQAAAIGLEEASQRFQEAAAAYPGLYPAGQTVRSLLLQHAIMLAAKGYNIENSAAAPDQMGRFCRQLESLAAALPEPAMGWQELLASAETDATTTERQLEAYRTLSMRQLASAMASQSRVLIPFYRYKNARKAFREDEALKHWQQAFAELPEMDEGQRYFYEAVLWGSREHYAEAEVAHRRHLALQAEREQQLQLPFSGQSQDGEQLRRMQRRNQMEQAMSLWVKLRQYHEAAAVWAELEKSEGKRWWHDNATPWKLLCDAAEFSEGLGQNSEALHYCEQAIQLLESRRNELSRDELRTALANDRGTQYLYFLGARLAFHKGDAILALHYAERGKARGLLDLLDASSSHLGAFAGEPESLRQWREANAKLTALRGLLGVERRKQAPEAARLGQLQQALDDERKRLSLLEQQLLLANPAFFAVAGGQGAIMDADAIGRELRPGQLLVEYYYRDEDLFCWAISADGLVYSASLPVAQEVLNRHAAGFHAACRDGGLYNSHGEQLSAWLLLPLSEVLEKYNTAYIVPSGRLHLIAFHALPFKQGVLGQVLQVSYLPSASILQYLEPPKLPLAPKVLVVGNPTGDLLAATAEAGAVGRLYGQPPLLGDDATETRVREALGQAQAIHLATHGRLSEEAPMASALILAGGAELSLYEIMGLKMQAELAVLSACDTGRGMTTNGDDVLGLARGILAAGAKGAVVSLWEVDDLSTSLLMIHFYQKLRSGTPPAVALQQARQFLRESGETRTIGHVDELEAAAETEQEKAAVRNLRGRRGIPLQKPGLEAEGYAHPFYWAPFFYIGKV